jgi:hypothetical protein
LSWIFGGRLQAAARLYSLATGKRDVMGHRFVVHEEYKANCVEAMDGFVAKL